MVLHKVFRYFLASTLIFNFSLQANAQNERQKRVRVSHLEYPLRDSSDHIISHEGFSLVYAHEHEQAYWVAYHLTPKRLQGKVKRTGHFRPDPDVPDGTAEVGDYRNSGLDRGHLAPAGDMKWSETAMKESFYFSNISPQNPKFNRGIWRQLEEKVREFALLSDTLYIATGPVFMQNIGSIGPNSVTVPNAYFKALLGYWDKRWHAIGFIVEQFPISSGELHEFAVSIDDLERITRMNFFHRLDDEIEDEIEQSFDYSEWEKKEP
ncbi:MAG: DNA/RNA non-specific endonuclease [Crocinitomicaceae bacterium]|jgi:endonuclease G|nr:DNA/RNA non-specific endonuclease [Crocinitomicaceae bacterium]